MHTYAHRMKMETLVEDAIKKIMATKTPSDIVKTNDETTRENECSGDGCSL